MVLAYAAALNSESLLDDAAGDFRALPFFCTALEWQLVTASRDLLDLQPEEAVRAVHAGQSTQFLKPLTPNQIVQVQGKIVEIRRSSAGALMVTRVDVSDREDDIVSTSRSVTIFRQVDVVGPNRSLERPTSQATSDAYVEEQETIIPLDRGFPHRYSECANIWNPIHTERRVALAAGLPDIIVHGSALWALAGMTLISRFAPAEPWRLRSLSGRFFSMVIAGTPITVRHGYTAGGREVIFSLQNNCGEKAIGEGRAVFD
jgi:acyl dehydratase